MNNYLFAGVSYSVFHFSLAKFYTEEQREVAIIAVLFDWRGLGLKPTQRQQNSLVFITYFFPHVSSHEEKELFHEFISGAWLLKCNFLNILFMFLT
jgi:hypothetical protein